MPGGLITPSDNRYDDVRRLWNGLLDPRPAAIAMCTNANDVAEAIAIARERRMTVSVRGGGHGVGGRASRDGGLTIDLRAMRSVAVDGVRRIARAGGGATWSEFDRATSAHGLAVTGGLISSTGIAGLTLGGGIGWLVRKHGPSCDSLIGAEVVTADATIRSVSVERDPDLFWALRGAGFGLGVVTALEYRLHPLSQVIAGMVLHPAERAADLLRLFRDFCAGAPDELTAIAIFGFAPQAPFVPRQLLGRPIVAIAVCWSGPIEEGTRVLAPLRGFGPPTVDVIGTMPYTAVQSMLDATAPADRLNYWKSAFIPALTDDVIGHLAARGTSLPSPLAQIHVHQLGGAMSRVMSGTTAFDRRDAAFLVNIPTMFADRADADAMIAWTRECHRELTGGRQSANYANFQDRDDRRTDAWSESTLQRLTRVKQTYDPDHLFGEEPLR